MKPFIEDDLRHWLYLLFTIPFENRQIVISLGHFSQNKNQWTSRLEDEEKYTKKFIALTCNKSLTVTYVQRWWFTNKISHFLFSPAGFTSREQRICMISYIYITIILFNYKKKYNNLWKKQSTDEAHSDTLWMQVQFLNSVETLQGRQNSEVDVWLFGLCLKIL